MDVSGVSYEGGDSSEADTGDESVSESVEEEEYLLYSDERFSNESRVWPQTQFCFLSVTSKTWFYKDQPQPNGTK